MIFSCLYPAKATDESSPSISPPPVPRKQHVIPPATTGAGGTSNNQYRRHRPNGTSISLRIATEKILLLHRRTSVYEPRPNISPRPPRPRTSSAGRRRLHAPAHLRCACMFVHLHRYRALQTYGLRGRVPVLHLHPPRNCSLLTANC